MTRPLMVAAVLLCMGAAPSRPDAGANRPLPKEIRAFLRSSTMNNHGDGLMRLMAAVTLLQYDDIQEAANGIAQEPRLAVVATSELDSPNAAIPARFFELQRGLRAPARALADAATRHDDAKIGEALGRMVQACVACHSEFLERPAPGEAPIPPKRRHSGN